MAEKKIGNRTFRVKQPLATEALRLQFRITSLVKDREAFQKIMEAGAEAASSKDDNIKAKAGAQVINSVIAVFGSIDPDEGTSLMRDLVAMSEIKASNGQYERADIDTEFSEDPSGLFELIGFVMKEVLGPFVAGLLSAMRGK